MYKIYDANQNKMEENVKEIKLNKEQESQLIVFITCLVSEGFLLGGNYNKKETFEERQKYLFNNIEILVELYGNKFRDSCLLNQPNLSEPERP